MHLKSLEALVIQSPFYSFVVYCIIFLTNRPNSMVPHVDVLPVWLYESVEL